MSDNTHQNVINVRSALEAAGIAFEIRTLQNSARTVAEAAAAIGVKEGQIAKSLIFLANGAPVMVVASGDEQVDTERLGSLLGAKISRADADAVRAATGYPIGGVSPAGLPSELPVYIEESLARWDVVWAAAGTWHSVFSTTYKDLIHITSGTPSAVGKR